MYFYSDGVYIALVFLLSISNGFLTSVVGECPSSGKGPPQQQTASNMMGALGAGLEVGAGSAALVKLL